MSQPLYIAGYTPGYAQYAVVLGASIKKAGGEFWFSPLPEQGSWQKNVMMKPMAVEAAWGRHPERDLVLLDVDAVMTALPTWPVSDSHIRIYVAPPERVADYVFDFARGRNVPNPFHTETPAGGAVYFAALPLSKTIVQEWWRLCQEFSGLTNDEQCLREAVLRHPGTVIARFGKPTCITQLSVGIKHHGKRYPPKLAAIRKD
jgi:hypothetical protein